MERHELLEIEFKELKKSHESISSENRKLKEDLFFLNKDILFLNDGNSGLIAQELFQTIFRVLMMSLRNMTKLFRSF